MLKRNSSRYKKDAHPVTDVTLILVGLSRPAKTSVANQIQHHLKGYMENNPEPVPEDNCHKLEGKVLGLKVMTVNTPDVSEDEESNKSLGNKVKKYATGDFAVVMVMAGGSEEDRGIELERLSSFNKMAFGSKANKYTMTMVTSRNNNQDDDENAEEGGGMTNMSFDIDTDKANNDIQVQVLFSHAKTLVKQGQLPAKEIDPNAKLPPVNDESSDAQNGTMTTVKIESQPSEPASSGKGTKADSKKLTKKGSYKKLK